MYRSGETGLFNKKRNQGQPYIKGNRFKRPVEKKEEFNINRENFPQMTLECRDEKVEKVIKNFKELDFREEKKEEKEEKIKKGWLILNKENLRNYKLEKEREKEREEIFVAKQVFSKMVNNWENYRREVNMILGDRSPYINTEREIDEIIKEELKIQREIDEYNEDKRMGRLGEMEEMESEEIYN